MFIYRFLKDCFNKAGCFFDKKYISFHVDKNNLFNVQNKEAFKGRVKIKGNNNHFLLPIDSSFSGSLEVVGEGNEVKVGKNVRFSGRLVLNGTNQKVTIGDHSTFQSVYLLCSEGCNIEIGSWCMLSRDIEIRTTDAHSLVDIHTLERVNNPSSVTIGDHVWIGVGSLISKGCSIPNDSVVGAYSFVNNKFEEENVLIAGTPAKVIKREITWNRGREPKFTKAQLEHWKNPN